VNPDSVVDNESSEKKEPMPSRSESSTIILLSELSTPTVVDCGDDDDGDDDDGLSDMTNLARNALQSSPSSSLSSSGFVISSSSSFSVFAKRWDD